LYSCTEDDNSNNPPTCKITSPDNGQTILIGDVVDIFVDAEDNDSKITEIRYYINDNGVGSSTVFPYKFQWNTNALAVGNYKIKAKAFDDEGGSASDEIDVIINNSFTDVRDDKTYSVVKIGEQYWMAENLNYNINTGSWDYDYSADNSNAYGKLYNWTTACDACPDGWHLPSDNEWKTLEVFLGMTQTEVEYYGWRGNDVGGKLKESGSDHWSSPNYGASNSSDFNALPSGAMDDYDYFFYDLTFGAYYWTSTGESSSYAYYRYLSYDNSGIFRSYKDKNDALSVRCVKD